MCGMKPISGYPMEIVRSEITYTQATPNRLVSYTYTFMNLHMYVKLIIREQEVINLRRKGSRYIAEVGERKGKREVRKF